MFLNFSSIAQGALWILSLLPFPSFSSPESTVGFRHPAWGPVDEGALEPEGVREPLEKGGEGPGARDWGLGGETHSLHTRCDFQWTVRFTASVLAPKGGNALNKLLAILPDRQGSSRVAQDPHSPLAVPLSPVRLPVGPGRGVERDGRDRDGQERGS